jgi:hypothetical protein
MTRTVDNLTDPAFVVYGIDADKKPRAARFDNSQPKLVAKAAELMNLTLYEVNSPQLPLWRKSYRMAACTRTATASCRRSGETSIQRSPR